jgi:hypothetical protein
MNLTSSKSSVEKWKIKRKSMKKTNYAPVSYVMQRDGRTRKYFENMMRSPYNHNRVIRENGEIIVHINYDNPLSIEIETLYFEALQTVKNSHALAVKLSQYCDADEVNSIYLYLRHFKFKHYERAKKIQDLLLQYLHDIEK